MNFLKPKFWDKNKITLLAFIFLPIAFIIQTLSFVKKNLIKIKKCEIPTICVGNIYLGGTGKTPLCIEIFLILKKLNFKPAFVRKKYRSFKDEVDLQKKIGPVYENKKRINALKEAIKNGNDVAILDDGFQDYSIYKNLSIVCFNEKQWIGNALTIPSGPLRENLSALKRANIVVINGKKNTVIEEKIYKKNKNLKIYYASYKAHEIEKYKNKKVIAFAGIGNPGNFFSLLKENNINVLEEMGFPDHHYYNKQEMEKLINKASKNNASLVTTEKDFIRLENAFKKHINYLKISIEIENKNHFVNQLKNIL